MNEKKHTNLTYLMLQYWYYLKKHMLGGGRYEQQQLHSETKWTNQN